MSLILPRRFRSQPQYAPRIDYQGLGKGVKLLVHPPSGYVDLITGRHWTRNGNTQIVNAQHGRAVSFDANNSSLNYTGYPELSGLGTFFAFFARVGASDSFGHGYLSSVSPITKYYLVSSAGKVWAGTPYGSNETISGWFNTRNRSLVLVDGPGPTEVMAYIDGVAAGLTWSSSGSSNWGSGNKTLEIGGDPASTTWDANVDFLVLGWTSEKWGRSESQAFNDSSGLALFESPRRLWDVPITTGFTLTADSGSFGVTGTAANLELGRLLSAASGSFEVTGQAATLGKGYGISAASGSVEITGAAALLAYGRVLPCLAGSFEINGADASLEYGRVLAAGSGSFAITGQPANLVHGVTGSYTLTANPGAFSITGADAGLTVTRYLSSQSGAFSITGTSASFELTRYLSAEAGSFSVSGTDASLNRGRTLTADAGSFAFSGQAATLRYARAVIAEAGQFAMTGMDAVLSRTGGPDPISSLVERTATFRPSVEHSATFRPSKSVDVRFN